MRRIPLCIRRSTPLIIMGIVCPISAWRRQRGEGKSLAEMAKAFGEASATDNGLTTGEQARQFAFGQVRDAVSGEVNQQIESWLSPWGNASVNVLVDNDGKFNGSSGTGSVEY